MASSFALLNAGRECLQGSARDFDFSSSAGPSSLGAEGAGSAPENARGPASRLSAATPGATREDGLAPILPLFCGVG